MLNRALRKRLTKNPMYNVCELINNYCFYYKQQRRRNEYIKITENITLMFELLINREQDIFDFYLRNFIVEKHSLENNDQE